MTGAINECGEWRFHDSADFLWHCDLPRFIDSQALGDLAIQSAADNPHDQPPSEEAELIRDPQCGTYFLTQRGVEARIGGRSVYFCSKECRDKYLVSHGET